MWFLPWWTTLIRNAKIIIRSHLPGISNDDDKDRGCRFSAGYGWKHDLNTSYTVTNGRLNFNFNIDVPNPCDNGSVTGREPNHFNRYRGPTVATAAPRPASVATFAPTDARNTEKNGWRFSRGRRW